MNMDNDPYVLDLDDNGMVALTKKNADFIDGILAIDSAYSVSQSEELFKENGITQDETILLQQINAVDRENSTHLHVDDAITDITKVISEIENLENKLKTRDFRIVDDIATASKRKNYSFATKFCAYACRFCFDEPYDDNYSIYDKVVAQVIPYYALRYCGNRDYYIRPKRKNCYYKSKYPDAIGGEDGYKNYSNLIDSIIEAGYGKTGYRLSRNQFDHILWYANKGNEQSRVKKISELLKNAAEQ